MLVKKENLYFEEFGGVDYCVKAATKREKIVKLQELY